MSESGNGDIVCTMARPHPPSYLFFNSFSVSITGGEIDSVEIVKPGGMLQSPGDYTHDLSKGNYTC